jgi:hypothetical protein
MLLKREEFSRLMGIYGALLTEKQRQVLHLYLDQDLSLQEIGEKLGISRQGVHDLLKRSFQALLDLENKLCFEQKLEEIQKRVISFLQGLGTLEENSLNDLRGLFHV